MTAPSWTVEPWATAADVCSPCTEATADLDVWLQVASDLLFELSGQRFPGVLEDTVRPCAPGCGGSSANGTISPDTYAGVYTDVYLGVSEGGEWTGSCGCGQGPACGCTTLSELTLNGWPLLSVTEVVIDGNVLDPNLYRVDDWQRLVRLRGAETSVQSWPACQQLDLPTTDPDTFEITFEYGQAPPDAGKHAAASLACQLALACAGSSDCRLPQRVQSVTRQGVSMVLLDPLTFFDDGRTGLYDVDLFLAAYGPQAKKRWPALVVNPAARARVRRETG